MLRYFLPIILVLTNLSVQSQKYTTPGSGIKWNLDSMVMKSPPTVTFSDGVYTLRQHLEIAASDTIVLRPRDFIKIDSAILITVFGTFISQGTVKDTITITALDSLKPYNGFRFEEISSAIFDYTKVKLGGGLKLITPNTAISNCLFAYNTKGIASGAVLDLSAGSPLIQNNSFIRNARPAVSSPANRTVSAKIINNYIIGNNQLNENRPQINMGTTGKDTLKIIGNTIIGDRKMDRVGGIAVSNLLNSSDGITAIIADNTIVDNRYGMTIAGGNANALIKNNLIEKNDSEGKPNLGGSGISLNSGTNTQNISITGNVIRKNLWGITIVGKAAANLGDDVNNPGNNTFADNGNEGIVYALYNNTANTILAKHNCWKEGFKSTLEEAGIVIFDMADDSKLGQVLYDPILCAVTSATDDSHDAPVSFYPNPAHDEIFLTGQEMPSEMSIFSLDGRLVMKKNKDTLSEAISIDLEPGMYVVQLIYTDKRWRQKLVVR